MNSSMHEMNCRIVTDADTIDRKKWEQFVYDHPQGSVYQTPLMYTAYGATRNYRPILVACFEDDAIVGLLLAVVQREYKGILGNLSARSIILGGPLIKDNNIQVFNAVMHAYGQASRKHAIYTQIRNMFSMEWAKAHLHQLGYAYEDHLNILIDLEKSEEQLWKDVHSKRKNEIRRAAKEGTSIDAFASVEAFEASWPIFRDVYQRARLPLPDVSLFKELLIQGPGSSSLKVFTAMNNGEVIGALLALCWRERVIDWYAGAYQKYLRNYPNDLLPWEAILWAKRNGYKIFDFGGAGKPGIPYGVRDFKLKFGGELVNFGRFQNTHRPIVMNIAKLGFRLWQLLKK